MQSNETMKVLGDGPIIDKDKNGDNVPELEQVHCFNTLQCCSQ